MFKWLSDSCTIHNFKYIWLQHDCTILYIYHICWWERSDNRIIEYDPLYFSYPKKHHKLNIFYIEIAIMHYVNFSCHWCMVDVGRIIRKKLPCGSVAFQRWQWWVVSIPPPLSSQVHGHWLAGQSCGTVPATTVQSPPIQQRSAYKQDHVAMTQLHVAIHPGDDDSDNDDDDDHVLERIYTGHLAMDPTSNIIHWSHFRGK